MNVLPLLFSRPVNFFMFCFREFNFKLLHRNLKYTLVCIACQLIATSQTRVIKNKDISFLMLSKTNDTKFVPHVRKRNEPI